MEFIDLKTQYTDCNLRLPFSPYLAEEDQMAMIEAVC